MAREPLRAGARGAGAGSQEGAGPEAWGLPAKCRARSCWSSDRMLTVNGRPGSKRAAFEVRAREIRTSGGSRETAVKAFTVAPWQVSAAVQLTTVTPVAK
ncbi:hypothetical protein SGFS_103490 [Streptomyces graminofaciens]|uniref:Uncharacterized protein n=1 Tax=Streptomyces graminofaciens TaxID=68212 RepID=A0ABN5W0Q8_9ACTN|nr:hypothetical protein SGFS_103490 [Streptomyces graminofaciens]